MQLLRLTANPMLDAMAALSNISPVGVTVVAVLQRLQALASKA